MELDDQVTHAQPQALVDFDKLGQLIGALNKASPVRALLGLSTGFLAVSAGVAISAVAANG